MISQCIHSKRDLVKKWIQVELAQCLQCFIPFTQLPFLKILKRFYFLWVYKGRMYMFTEQVFNLVPYIFMILLLLYSIPVVRAHSKRICGRKRMFVNPGDEIVILWGSSLTFLEIFAFLIGGFDHMNDTTLISECLGESRRQGVISLA